MIVKTVSGGVLDIRKCDKHSRHYDVRWGCSSCSYLEKELPEKPKVLVTQKWGVLATPPQTGTYSDLKPRFQMWVNGSTVEYESKEEAEQWARACNSDRNGWTYSVREIAE